jgi:gas vesicle protein
MSNNKDLATGLAVGLGVGLIVGGVLGVLFAPKSGVETRKDIKNTVDKGVTKLKGIPADIRAKLNKSTIDDIKKR